MRMFLMRKSIRGERARFALPCASILLFGAWALYWDRNWGLSAFSTPARSHSIFNRLGLVLPARICRQQLRLQFRATPEFARFVHELGSGCNPHWTVNLISSSVSESFLLSPL